MKIGFVLFLNVLFLTSNACTTFFINKNGQMVFGRNYDWITGSGMVIVNTRGVAKSSMKAKEGNTISWVSKYGSITFNQYGKEFPTGGMNEKGLIVELMWLDGTQYPSPDQRPAVGVLQWIQYQLDNCATVEDLIATDSKIRIASVGTTPLHYLVADQNGNAATIEFLDGKMVVHRKKELPHAVLTNTAYAESVKLVDQQKSFADNSLERFITACKMVKNAEQLPVGKSMVDYSFGILDEVAQGDFTKWSIVYDLKNKTVNFRVNGSRQVKSVSFSSFNFSCKEKSKVFLLDTEAKGNVSSMFTDFSIGINKQVVEKSFEESSERIPSSPEGRKSVWSYPEHISCPGTVKSGH